MASLDVDSLFTNIPLHETIDICIDSLYKDDVNTPKIPKDVFRHLLTVATKESFFMFNNKFYKQIDGVAMESPLGPALANIFLSNFENKWLKDCPHRSLSSIDGMLMIYLYCFPVSIKQKSLKSPNTNFSLEKENDVRLSFLDVNIFREKENLFIGKRPSVVFTLISTASYLKPIKPV